MYLTPRILLQAYISLGGGVLLTGVVLNSVMADPEISVYPILLILLGSLLLTTTPLLHGLLMKWHRQSLYRDIGLTLSMIKQPNASNQTKRNES